MRHLALTLALLCAVGLGSAVWAQEDGQAQATDQQSVQQVDQQSLQQQIDELKARLADYDELKARLAELEKAAAKVSTAPQPVQPAFPNSKIKIDGRLFSGTPETLHWSLPCPAAVEGSLEARREAFRRVRDDVRERVRALVARIRRRAA